MDIPANSEAADGLDDLLLKSLLATDGPDVTRQVIQEFRRGWELERLGAEDRQRLIGAHHTKHEKKLGNGALGQHVASIDAYVYQHWQEKQPGCWQDPQFVREFLRDNPHCRVKTAQTSNRVVVPDSKFTRQREKREAAERAALETQMNR